MKENSYSISMAIQRKRFGNWRSILFSFLVWVYVIINLGRKCWVFCQVPKLGTTWGVQLTRCCVPTQARN